MRHTAAWLLAGVTWLLGVADVGAEPLMDVLAKVYLASPRLEAGRASLRAVDESVARARAAGRPSLTASSSVAAAADSGYDSQRQALRLTQSLYSGGETTAAIARAESAVRAERARLAQLEQDVLLETITAYTAVAREEAVLALARANEERLRIQRDATHDRERFGDVTKTDVAQAETRYARAIAARIAAEGDLEAAAAVYRQLVGDAPGALSLPPPADGLPATRDEAIALAEDSWRLQAAGHELAAAQGDVRVALAGLKPRLSLGGELSYADGAGSYDGPGSGAVVGATLAVPLYQGGGEYARVRQSKELLAQRRHGLDDALRAAETEVALAWEALRTAAAAIRSLQAQVDSAAFAVEGVRQEALAGARTVLDVLDAEEELHEAEVDLVRANRERVLAGYRLRAAIGRLTARDLALPVELHDPQRHYDAVSGRWFGLGGDVGED